MRVVDGKRSVVIVDAIAEEGRGGDACKDLC